MKNTKMLVYCEEANLMSSRASDTSQGSNDLSSTFPFAYWVLLRRQNASCDATWLNKIKDMEVNSD